MTPKPADVKRFLATLRRIPDDVILSMGTREFVMQDTNSCLCGWAVREDLLRAVGSDRALYYRSTLQSAIEHFGGESSEWDELFYDGAFSQAGETAFTLRVMEAAGV